MFLYIARLNKGMGLYAIVYIVASELKDPICQLERNIMFLDNLNTRAGGRIGRDGHLDQLEAYDLL